MSLPADLTSLSRDELLTLVVQQQRQIAELMGRTARVGEMTMIPIRETEPISLNTAYGVRDFLRKEGIQSVAVVAPAFRSRRSAMIYGTVLAPAGIAMRCVPHRIQLPGRRLRMAISPRPLQKVRRYQFLQRFLPA